MKPFLHLSVRDEDDAVVGEVDAVVLLAGLDRADVVHVRVEQSPLNGLRPSDFSGVIIGGGPFNASDDPKTPLQQRVEADLGRVVAAALTDNIPLLGMCYGVGLVTQQLGGVVDRTFSEPVGATRVELTDQGRDDPLFGGLPPEFMAFTGHKEACALMPEGAVLLATGPVCPVQAFRVGEAAYVTQFHPELDLPRLAERMAIYKHAGYFDPDEYHDIVAEAAVSGVGAAPGLILANFARLFAR